MANKHRAEVPFPEMGEGAFIQFNLDDLESLEEEFGSNFFAEVEVAAYEASPKKLSKVLGIGLKRRDGDGKVSKLWGKLDRQQLFNNGFSYTDCFQPVMNALSMAHLKKSHADLVKEVEEQRKKQTSEQIAKLKGAADEAGVPFETALSSGLLKLLTGLDFAQTESGD